MKKTLLTLRKMTMDDIAQDSFQHFGSLYLYLGLVTGTLSIPGMVEHLTHSLQHKTVNRAYVEYLRDKLSQALKDSE